MRIIHFSEESKSTPLIEAYPILSSIHHEVLHIREHIVDRLKPSAKMAFLLAGMTSILLSLAGAFWGQPAKISGAVKLGYGGHMTCDFESARKIF